MSERGFTIEGLGEVAIRVARMDTMVRFYRDTLGLDVMAGGEDADITFFRIAEGVAGHTTVLALFRHGAGNPALHETADDPPLTGARSSLHHIALSLPFSQQRAVMAWYDAHGIDYAVQQFDWVGWRGVFTKDPEGNTVELVAKDPDWCAPTANGED